MCKKGCKYLIKNEIIKDGVAYDGCRKSVKHLADDICDCTSSFCKEVRETKVN